MIDLVFWVIYSLDSGGTADFLQCISLASKLCDQQQQDFKDVAQGRAWQEG